MQARAPDEGPSGSRPSVSETGGQLVSLDIKNEERHDPILLRAVVKRYNIGSTKSLVAASNVATDEYERAVLLGWLCNYHERREDCLTSKAVLEYAELADIAPRSRSEEDIVKNLIDDLCSCISEGEFLAPNFAAALHRALVHVNPSVYGGVAQLLLVARKLLGSLSATPKLEKNNFWVYRGTFLALQQTFFLLGEDNQRGINEEEKKKLRQAVAKQRRALKQSRRYYPVKFHFEALRQAAKRLKARDSCCLAKASSYIIRGFGGLTNFVNSLRAVTTGGVDPAGVASVYRRRRVFFVNIRVARRQWFDLFRNLMVARLEAAKDEMKLDLFWSVFNVTVKNRRRMKDAEDLKALRFGVIHELGMLAIEGSSESTRIEATIRLSDLATGKAMSERWIGDDDILIALLDVIHEVHKTGQCTEKTKEALLALHQSCEGLVRDAMIVWLDGRSMEDKLRAKSPPGAQLGRKDLFVKTRKDVGYTSPTGEYFIQTYLQDDFAKVIFRQNEPSTGWIFPF